MQREPRRADFSLSKMEIWRRRWWQQLSNYEVEQQQVWKQCLPQKVRQLGESMKSSLVVDLVLCSLEVLLSQVLLVWSGGKWATKTEKM